MTTACKSTSQKAVERPGSEDHVRLASEVNVLWIDPDARDMEWLREHFHCQYSRTRLDTSGRVIRAITVDERGRIVRVFRASQEAIDAYRQEWHRGVFCPIEAVLPSSIKPGEPAIQAHDHLSRSRKATMEQH